MLVPILCKDLSICCQHFACICVYVLHHLQKNIIVYIFDGYLLLFSRHYSFILFREDLPEVLTSAGQYVFMQRYEMVSHLGQIEINFFSMKFLIYFKNLLNIFIYQNLIFGYFTSNMASCMRSNSFPSSRRTLKSSPILERSVVGISVKLRLKIYIFMHEVRPRFFHLLDYITLLGISKSGNWKKIKIKIELRKLM